jgi:aromatic ring-opening dioxygenase catalytic subunit (LigB family)
LHADLDPRTHLEIGRALSDLRKRDLLIIGSGFSFHNLRAFFAPGGAIDRENDAFQQWLLETCIQASADDRERMLIEWEKAPYARLCHPREEHLLPLHVCCGVTGSPATVVFDGRLLGKRALGLLW